MQLNSGRCPSWEKSLNRGRLNHEEATAGLQNPPPGLGELCPARTSDDGPASQVRAVGCASASPRGLAGAMWF